MSAVMARNWTGGRAALISAATAALLATLTVPPKYPLAAALALAAVIGTLRYPLIGFCLLALSVPWGSSLALGSGSFPITPTDLIVALLGFVWLVRSVARREQPLAGAPWLPWIALFLAAIALSVNQAVDTRSAAAEIVKWLELATVYVAGTRFIVTKRQSEIVVAAVVAGGVSQALLGFTQTVLSLGPASFAAQRLLLRAYGTFDQPNPYAGYLNLVLPLALAMVLVGTRGRMRAAYLLSSLLIFGAVLASESRGALLAGSVGIAVMLALQYQSVLRALWLGILAVSVGALLAVYDFIPIGAFDRVLMPLGLTNVAFNDVNDSNFATVERAAHWLAGVRMFQAHPLLGVGIGNYSTAYPAYHPRGWYAALGHAHNYYINIAAEAGIIGLTAYTLLVGSALWYSFVALRSARGPVFRAVGLGVTGALVATSFHNIFDVLYVHGITNLLGLLMALVFVPLIHREADGTGRREYSVGS